MLPQGLTWLSHTTESLDLLPASPHISRRVLLTLSAPPECAQLLLRGSRASALAEEIKRPAGEGGDEGLRGLAAGRGGADLGGDFLFHFGLGDNLRSFGKRQRGVRQLLGVWG